MSGKCDCNSTNPFREYNSFCKPCPLHLSKLWGLPLAKLYGISKIKKRQKCIIYSSSTTIWPNCTKFDSALGQQYTWKVWRMGGSRDMQKLASFIVRYLPYKIWNYETNHSLLFMYSHKYLCMKINSVFVVLALVSYLLNKNLLIKQYINVMAEHFYSK